MSATGRRLVCRGRPCRPAVSFSTGCACRARFTCCRTGCAGGGRPWATWEQGPRRSLVTVGGAWSLLRFCGSAGGAAVITACSPRRRRQGLMAQQLLDEVNYCLRRGAHLSAGNVFYRRPVCPACTGSILPIRRCGGGVDCARWPGAAGTAGK
jgi:hypothetical protein